MLLFVAFSVWSARLAVADHRLHLEESVRPHGQEKVTKRYDQVIHIGTKRARIDWPARSRIIRLDGQVLYLLNHFNKTYHVIPLPPDYKDYVEAEVWNQPKNMLNGMFKKEAAKVTPAGESKKIGPWNATRFDCVVHDEYSKKVSEITLWQSSDLAIDVSIYKELRRNYALVGDYGQSQWIDQILALEGFGVLVEWTEYGQVGTFTTTRRLESITEEDVSGDFYEPPPDYELKPYHQALFVSLDELR